MTRKTPKPLKIRISARALFTREAIRAMADQIVPYVTLGRCPLDYNPPHPGDSPVLHLAQKS